MTSSCIWSGNRQGSTASDEGDRTDRLARVSGQRPTKAFWLTILIIPLILLGMYFLQSALSRATPVRHFIVIDQSGWYEEAVSIAVEREHQRLILTDFVEYLIENRRESNLEASPANATNAANQLIDDVDANEVAALDEWLDSGGLNFALAMATPYL